MPINRISRRSFLAASLGAVAAGMLPGCSQGRFPGGPRIAVVGAGLAGLYAARALRPVAKVTIYEASGRVGGRVLTRRGGFLAEQSAELGADRFPADGRVAELALSLGLKLAEIATAEDKLAETAWSDGAILDPAQLRERLAGLDRLVGAPGATVADRLAAAGIAPSPLLDAAITAAYGREAARIDAAHLAKAGSPSRFGPPRGGVRIAGGNDRLAPALADGLDISFGRRLTAIDGSGPWELTFTGKGGAETVVADAVVLAIPLALLPSVRLPAAWNLGPALALADTGSHTRLLVATATRPWRERGQNGSFLADSGAFRCGWDATSGQAGGAGVLTLQAGGAEAVATADAAVATSITATAAVADAGRLFPELAAVAGGGPHLHAWQHEPHALGSIPGFRAGGVAAWAAALDGMPAGIALAGDHDVRTGAWGAEAALASAAAAAERMRGFLA